jgi:hypothetical protein
VTHSVVFLLGFFQNRQFQWQPCLLGLESPGTGDCTGNVQAISKGCNSWNWMQWEIFPIILNQVKESKAFVDQIKWHQQTSWATPANLFHLIKYTKQNFHKHFPKLSSIFKWKSWSSFVYLVCPCVPDIFPSNGEYKICEIFSPSLLSTAWLSIEFKTDITFS